MGRHLCFAAKDIHVVPQSVTRRHGEDTAMTTVHFSQRLAVTLRRGNAVVWLRRALISLLPVVVFCEMSSHRIFNECSSKKH